MQTGFLYQGEPAIANMALIMSRSKSHTKCLRVSLAPWGTDSSLDLVMISKNYLSVKASYTGKRVVCLCVPYPEPHWKHQLGYSSGFDVRICFYMLLYLMLLTDSNQISIELLVLALFFF